MLDAPLLARPKVTYTDSHTRACRRVGSQTMADTLAGYINGVWRWADPMPPDGWQVLGAGATRRAVLGPDGWVYKVLIDRQDDASAIEAQYWLMALRHREFRPHVPHFRTFEVKVRTASGEKVTTVLAMEQLAVNWRLGSSDEAEKVRKMASHIGCRDIHGANIGWRGQQAVLLDAGSGVNGVISRTHGCETCNPRFSSNY